MIMMLDMRRWESARTAVDDATHGVVDESVHLAAQGEMPITIDTSFESEDAYEPEMLGRDRKGEMGKRTGLSSWTTRFEPALRVVPVPGEAILMFWATTAHANAVTQRRCLNEGNMV